MSAPAATLAEYDDTALARWYNASDGEEWHAVLEAEMERRDAQDAAKPRAPRRAGPVRSEWHDAAYSQYLAA